MSERLVLPGRLTISRPSASNGEEYVAVTLVDDGSGVQFVEARVPLASFAEAVTGLGHVHCTLHLLGLDRVGMLSEVKEEWVPDLGDIKRRREALAPFEVDGWRARESDYGNWHRHRAKPPAYRVTFHRHVPRPSDQPLPEDGVSPHAVPVDKEGSARPNPRSGEQAPATGAAPSAGDG